MKPEPGRPARPDPHQDHQVECEHEQEPRGQSPPSRQNAGDPTPVNQDQVQREQGQIDRALILVEKCDARQRPRPHQVHEAAMGADRPEVEKNRRGQRQQHEELAVGGKGVEVEQSGGEDDIEQAREERLVRPAGGLSVSPPESACDSAEQQRRREHDPDRDQMKQPHPPDSTGDGLRRRVGQIDQRRFVVDDIHVKNVARQHLAGDDGICGLVIGETRANQRHQPQYKTDQQQEEGRTSTAGPLLGRCLAHFQRTLSWVSAPP